jgi:uncharacterized protein DUF1801
VARGNATVPSGADVDAFVEAVADEARRRDAQTLLVLLREATGEQPALWGTSIVGFGSRHYRYASGREGDTPAVAFSPRKAQSVLYLTGGLDDYADLLSRLGPHSTGKGCLYVKRVDDVDADVLREVAARSYRRSAAETAG